MRLDKTFKPVGTSKEKILRTEPWSHLMIQVHCDKEEQEMAMDKEWPVS